MRRRAGRRATAAVGVVAVVAIALGGLAYAALGGAVPFGPSAPGTPRFVDETAASGLAHTYGGDFTPYDVGGGVAVLDCDGDGRPDLYVAGGANPAELFHNDSTIGGALRFTPVHDPATDLTGVLGAYPIDIDGDGNPDLVLLRFGETVILRGLGGCRFERANEALSFDAGRAYTTAFSATWEGRNRLPTLALGRYRSLDANGEPTFDCDADALVRPAASGSGYAAAVPLTPGYCSLSMLFSSWDHSGRRDLRVSNDRQYYGRVGEEQLWRMSPGEAPRLYTEADGWAPLQLWGMGIASYDLNGDGYPEVYLTSQGDNKLQTLRGSAAQPSYRDMALTAGVNFARPFAGGDILPSTSWHPEFQDVNNDGLVDLFVSKGNVSAMPDYAQRDPSDLALGQPDGTFKEVADAAGILNFDRGRGAALADFNLDGLLDLVEVNFRAPVRVWRNVGSGDAAKPVPMGNWLGVRVRQPEPNGDAIGAWIDIKTGSLTASRELTVGGGHEGGQLGWTHFGLGTASSAQVRIEWPDGEIGPWMPVRANEFVDIVRGAQGPRPWVPGNG